MFISEGSIKDHNYPFYDSNDTNENHPNELTPKSWTLCPTKGVLFYEQVQQAVQANGS
jgi:hypothetical protein